MIVARVVSSDRPEDLEIAFARMALPVSAREYLLGKMPRMTLLLTGLDRVHGRFLRERIEAAEAPGREEYPAFVAGDQRHRPGSALLSGRLDQMERLAQEARTAEDLRPLADALSRALRSHEPPAPLALGDRTFDFGPSGLPFLMGIVNATPDSFSDGGRFSGPEAVIEHGVALAAAGAELLDVGGESTRPGAPDVPVEEEIRRVVPVIRALRERTGLPISVDTRKSEVARAACEAGAVLVNDVSGLTHDDRLAEVTAQAGAALCVMHMRGSPETMQEEAHYEDVVVEVLEFLEHSIERAVRAGVPRERVIVDPGIGFAKTFAHNQFLMRRLPDFRLFGLPVLAGFSRKGFLGALTGKPPLERVGATAASAVVATMNGGADFLRVHDVAEVREAVIVAGALRHAMGGGSLYERPGRAARS
ncbi:MAG: dihydropteroate synthase [Myxococcaceae bacterium]